MLHAVAVTTYTATAQELRLALAEVLDWQAAPCESFETFSNMASAILQRLTAHEPSKPGKPVRSLDELSAVSADVLARAHDAGRELGAVRTDYYGQPTRAVAPPEGSARVKALRKWEAERVS